MSSQLPIETKFSQFLRYGGNGEFVVRLYPRPFETYQQKSDIDVEAAAQQFHDQLWAEATRIRSRIIEAIKTYAPDTNLDFEFDPSLEIETWIDQFRERLSNDPAQSNNMEVWVKRFGAELNQKWQAELGVKLYIWRSKDDDKVRSSHAEYDDQIFSWDKPPEGGHPGQDFNCRCWAEPYEHDYRRFFWEVILGHEGGYVDDPVDRGGATKFGITIDIWIVWSEKLFGIQPSIETLQEMTPEQAFEIFRVAYWSPSGADRLVDPDIAFQISDIAFNHGGGNAGKILQRAINDVGGNVIVDGAIGPKTIAAANELPVPDLYRAIRDRRWRFYEAIMRNDPSQERFRNGWYNRTISFDAY